MRRLTDDEFAAAKAAMLGSGGDALRLAIFEIGMGLPLTAKTGAAQATDLGWLEAGQLTELGRPIADPIREFVFWQRRDGKLLSGDIVPKLARESYADKNVIELGCGGGCNLLSMSGLPGRHVGIDPMPVAIQLLPVLAEVAGLEAPEAQEAPAEAVPYPDNEFDIALCYSSHQYMDLHKAFAEMDRIVHDDGEVYIIGGVFGPFIPESVTRFVKGRSLGTLKYDTFAILNTISYQLAGRRVLGGQADNTTSTPIYPTAGWMNKQLRKHNFVVDEKATSRLPGSEMAVIARRG
jgi:SAM-dependent methyltransferase